MRGWVFRVNSRRVSLGLIVGGCLKFRVNHRRVSSGLVTGGAFKVSGGSCSMLL